jgi:aromatic-L-amino-acid/L-tryptophan decarboxylase
MTMGVLPDSEGEAMSVPLRLPVDEMRKLGYQAVDDIVRHLDTLNGRAVGRSFSRQTVIRRFRGPLPEYPSPAAEVLRDAIQAIGDSIVHTDHPRFVAYVPGPSNFVAALGDFVAAGLNVHAGAWVLGAGPAVVEETVVDWLRRCCKLPDTAGGLFLSGGTMATLTAIHAARSTHLTASGGDSLVYISQQTHASIRRGLTFLGIATNQIRVVPVDRGYRMDPVALDDQIRRDRRRGHRPLCVIATAGTTSTGAVDPLATIADVCQDAFAWLHVDGAYGAAAAITSQCDDLLAGLGRADSIAVDPHKWWFQPYEAGCLLVRDATTLVRTYGLTAEYLAETRLGDQPLNYYDRGPQLTRGFRALKLWLSLRVFGLAAFRAAVEHGIALADRTQEMLENNERWEVTSPAQLGIVTFRPVCSGLNSAELDRLTRAVAARTVDDGYAMVITTELDGRPVLRMCTIHPELTQAHVAATLERLGELADELRSQRDRDA